MSYNRTHHSAASSPSVDSNSMTNDLAHVLQTKYPKLKYVTKTQAQTPPKQTLPGRAAYHSIHIPALADSGALFLPRGATRFPTFTRHTKSFTVSQPVLREQTGWSSSGACYCQHSPLPQQSSLSWSLRTVGCERKRRLQRRLLLPPLCSSSVFANSLLYFSTANAEDLVSPGPIHPPRFRIALSTISAAV